MVRVGLDHEVAGERLLVGTGLTVDELDRADDAVEASQELAVARNLVGELGDRPGLGLEVATGLGLNSFGLLGFALLSSPTVGDAARIGLRYLNLCHVFVTVSVTVGLNGVRVAFDDDDLPEDVRPFLVERDLAIIIGVLMAGIFGTEAVTRGPDIQLELSLGAERGRPLGEQLSPLSVSYGRPRSVLTFPADLLSAPAPMPDDATARLCERQCHEVVQHRRERHGLAAQVRGRLLRDPGSMPSATDIAAELHVDRRTLHRRLADEETSFRALREETLHGLAAEMLTVLHLSVEETAQRLGYATASAFTHAYTRWAGSPPSRHLPRTEKSPDTRTRIRDEATAVAQVLAGSGDAEARSWGEALTWFAEHIHGDRQQARAAFAERFGVQLPARRA
ncbi:AraC family transcriptional regulator [Pseudonocardiaceae bacterium YIM PH 21723]|nr:AraC family transcriptional regulator [Pseudonocardiaceae bacterium YIM PH 21723]